MGLLFSLVFLDFLQIIKALPGNDPLHGSRLSALIPPEFSIVLVHSLDLPLDLFVLIKLDLNLFPVLSELIDNSQPFGLSFYVEDQ